jgi:DNA-binding YbaB/EbfC family protein
MKGGINSMVRQAQKMQAQVSKVQQEVGEMKIEASSGGGVVTAVVNGNQELLDIKIDPEVVDPEEIEILQELVVGAVNQAMKTASDVMDKEIEKITGGLSIPGLT